MFQALSQRRLCWCHRSRWNLPHWHMHVRGFLRSRPFHNFSVITQNQKKDLLSLLINVWSLAFSDAQKKKVINIWDKSSPLKSTRPAWKKKLLIQFVEPYHSDMLVYAPCACDVYQEMHGDLDSHWWEQKVAASIVFPPHCLVPLSLCLSLSILVWEICPSTDQFLRVSWSSVASKANMMPVVWSN